jgi:hypothetical protein
MAWAVYDGRVLVLIDERCRQDKATRKPYWCAQLVHDEGCWERLATMRRRADGIWAVGDKDKARRCFVAICCREFSMTTQEGRNDS